MTNWVDFGALKQSIGIEAVLEHYGVRLKRVHSHYLRGRCPLLCPRTVRNRAGRALPFTPTRTYGHASRLRAGKRARGR